MLGWRCGLATPFVLLTLQGAAIEKSRSSLDGWRELVGWLPENTETVVVAQGPLVIPDPEAEGHSVEQTIELLPMAPILGLQNGLLHRQLFGQNVLLAVEGGRRFKSPKALGGALYEGSHIIQFDPESQGVLRRVFQSCYERADNTVELAGNAVAVFKETLESDEWSFYLNFAPKQRMRRSSELIPIAFD